MARYEEQILSLNTKINTIQGKVDLSKSRRRFTIWLLYIVYMHVHRDLTLIVSDVCAGSLKQHFTTTVPYPQ